MREAFSCLLDERLARLLAWQFRGRLRRSWRRLRSPRRLVPTLLVGLFLLLYLVQIYIAVAFHPSSATFDVNAIAPLGMLGILTLKLLGVCLDRNKSGAGFRDEEIHQLLGGPFALQQVRLYRVYGHAISIFCTSVFAALFFRFHVRSLAAALLGSYLAMIFTYLVHGIVAVTAVQVREPTYRRVRSLACGTLAGLLVYCLYRVSQRDLSNVEFVHALGNEILWLSQSLPGRLLTAPFQVFTRVITADCWSEVMTWLGPGLLLNLLGLQALLRVEVGLDRRTWHRVREDFECLEEQGLPVHPSRTNVTKHVFQRRIPWLGGAGPIVWRQLKAVARLRSGLSWLMVPTGVALALGCYWAYDPEQGAFLTIAVTVVLSSVFLPGLLPFDFRGDLQGLSALKMMPIRPPFVVLGQLAVPVAMLSLLQLTALSTLVLHDRSLQSTILLTLCFLIPTNTIILALENVIFLLYPYRLAEFDMQATVRRIVMLMAKFCVVFLAALIAILAGLGVLGIRMATQWVPVLGRIYSSMHAPILVCTQLVVLTMLAALVVWGTCWAYQRFDLNEDMPL